MPHEPRRYENPGKPPARWPPDTQIGVQWRNGQTSRDTFTAQQLRWAPWPEGEHPFDIALFWRA